MGAGTIACKPNAGNPRDLDISLEYMLEGMHGSWQSSQEFRMR